MSRREAAIGLDPDEELTTTQAARLAGVSRQHLVHLCELGLLPHRRVGTHRRVRADDLARHLPAATPAIPQLTRKDRISLAIHYLVAQRLLTDAPALRSRARRNLETLRRANRDGAATAYLEEWARLLDGPLELLLRALTGLDHRARDLRNVTPFAGVIPDARRRDLIRRIR